MMTTAPRLPPPRHAAPRDRYRIDDHAEILNAIHQLNVHTVHYRRRVPSTVTNYASSISCDAFALDLTSVGQTAEPQKALVQLPLRMAPGRDEFLAEVAFALSSFRHLVGGAPFEAELAVITDDACRRFHVDQHRLRWVTTFAGPGTEWLADDDVAPLLPPAASMAVSNYNERIAAPPAIRRLGRGEVLLMKGKGYRPRAPGRGGPLHRSPPIEGHGSRRLVLTLTLP